jgi:catechol 1,2-dioxygenase
MLIILGRIVNEITYASKSKENNGATPMAVLGPFYRDDAPVKEKNSNIVVNNDNGQVTYMHGRVLDCVTRRLSKTHLCRSGRLRQMDCTINRTQLR